METSGLPARCKFAHTPAICGLATVAFSNAGRRTFIYITIAWVMTKYQNLPRLFSTFRHLQPDQFYPSSNWCDSLLKICRCMTLPFHTYPCILIFFKQILATQVHLHIPYMPDLDGLTSIMESPNFIKLFFKNFPCTASKLFPQQEFKRSIRNLKTARQCRADFFLVAQADATKQ